MSGIALTQVLEISSPSAENVLPLGVGTAAPELLAPPAALDVVGEVVAEVAVVVELWPQADRAKAAQQAVAASRVVRVVI